MTRFGVRVERLYCPLCEWTHDRESPPQTTHTLPDGQSPLHDGPPATLQEAIADAAYATLLHDALQVEGVVREHLETHSLLEWFQEVMRLSANRPPATVYRVGVYCYDAGDQVELFSNLAAAEAYRSRLPGSDLDEMAVLDEAPTRVIVHCYSVTLDLAGRKPPFLRYSSAERRSHNLWPPAEEWTSPGGHAHVVRATADPLVCVLDTYGFDQQATWQACLDEAERLRREAEPSD